MTSTTPEPCTRSFSTLFGQRSGEELCETFVDACDRLGLLSKILGITTDNASNFDHFLVRFEGVCCSRGIAFDKKEQHVRCMAHVTDLDVQALLHKPSAEGSDADLCLDDDSPTPSEWLSCIAKLHCIVVKIHSSPQRRNEVKTQCEACVRNWMWGMPTSVGVAEELE